MLFIGESTGYQLERNVVVPNVFVWHRHWDGYRCELVSFSLECDP